MAGTRMVIYLALALLLATLPSRGAQAQQQGPAAEYTVLAELTQLAADGTERTVLSATGRMGASGQERRGWEQPVPRGTSSTGSRSRWSSFSTMPGRTWWWQRIQAAG